ncbi:hypothetical protein BEL04_17090 [Mucilaginibacter sp. PPCGB 2223]|uniref:MutS-related protein n=1 Tax=Mucilaginibacter sp. PPCGB 2223 TaxID=1886027 RepID=UPI000824E504|nr:hypothetical protein [Mucilaginibacter sp. PPCGB 2223]OCX51729.1 hypothetical protein BEL04_17090 [Mucilaginibacter sp. PPCGB 2223]
MNDDILQNYALAKASAQSEADRFKRLVNIYSFIRLGVFLLFLMFIVFAVKQESYLIFAVSFVVLGGSFAWLVQRQSVFEAQREYFENLKRVNENEIDSILNRGNLYDNGAAFADEKHYYTSDLDIFGQASLFQLINRCATADGNSKLADWLSSAADKEAILQRQQAVKELSGKSSWKTDFQAAVLFAMKQDKDQIRQLSSYLRLPIDMPGEKWLVVYCKIAPFLLVLLMIAGYFYSPFDKAAIGLGLINIGLVSSRGKYIKKTDTIAGKIGRVLGMYADIFAKIEDGQWQSKYLIDLAGTIKSEQLGSTSVQIKQLSRLIEKLNYHLNIIIGIFLNVFFLWDIRQIIAIEKWKHSNRQNLEQAFGVLAEIEALLSLSSLAINYPDWCYPEIADGDGYTLSAQSIAHPLINSKNRVDNDFELNNELKIDIITGSNMAGKSTFLRTLGINTVLALCGAPVCARSMNVSVMTIISYMRIKDSLNESTSTFKAELDRLQMLLAAVDGHEKVYFLIDEMLRGTNSVDKYKGSKAMIEQLISKKGVGLVATHDLQIAQLEQKYPEYVRNFYFDIQVIDGEMLFDYKIKHGECKTFNASLLLRQIGIDVDAV